MKMTKTSKHVDTYRATFSKGELVDILGGKVEAGMLPPNTKCVAVALCDDEKMHEVEAMVLTWEQSYDAKELDWDDSEHKWEEK